MCNRSRRLDGVERLGMVALGIFVAFTVVVGLLGLVYGLTVLFASILANAVWLALYL